MRRFFWAAAAAAVVLGATPGVGSAQFGGGPGVPAVPQPVVPGTAAGVAAPGPRVGLFQRLGQGLGNKFQNLLSSPLGQLLSNATKPLSALTGGVIPALEKKATAEETKQPGVAGPAAQGKKDAAEAAKRRADVKYLGTLDCRYYPEASKALADALRTDPNECVRYEAALALSRGCCCNQVTIAALTASVSGYESDGNPGERSARVRCTAAVALEKCLACYVQYGSPDDLKPDEDCPKKPKPKEEPKKEGEQPKEGEKADDKNPDDKKVSSGPCGPPSRRQVERAKEVLAAFADTYATTAAMYGQPLASGTRTSPGILDAGGVQVQAKAPAPAVTPAAFATRTPAPVQAVATARPAPQLKAVEAPPPAPGISRVRFRPDDVAVPPPAVSGPVVPAVEPAPVLLPTTEVKPVEAVTPVAAVAVESADAKAVEALVHRVLLGDTPADQHAAVRQLVKYDWAAHPLVASCLVAGAKSAATAAVRVDCLRHLAHHQMCHKDVIAALGELSNDADSWVREEAAKASEALKK